MATEKHEFKSEAKQVLDLMIHSVYSNPDIFVRELISNASDALDKLRIESLSDTSLEKYAENPEINIFIDKENKTLTISDNGIGMSKEDLVNYLGTIAKSGTDDFINALKESKKTDDSDLIGHFGVGFYSCFIASDSVKVETKKVGSDESYVWESTGDGTFTITPGDRDTNGTSIIMHIKENEVKDEHDVDTDYMSKWVLHNIIKKYSDFVTYPIYLTDLSEEKKEEDKERKPVNSMKALWTRPEDEVKEEEYNEFYKHLSHDWENPLERISYKVEGTSQFTSLLYIPNHQPNDLFFQDGKHGIDLYIRKVFIMNDCHALIPDYLRFVKGVVDSDDLPLNVSREILQQSRQTNIIKNSITRKVLETLGKMKKEESEKYGEFWKKFGIVLKEGIVSDAKNRKQILKLCILNSSKGGTTTLEEYVNNMATDQEQIYYITGAKADVLMKSPKLETFRKRDIEVLILDEAVDELWVNAAMNFDNKEFVSVSREDVKLPESTESEEEKEAKEQIEKSGFLTKIKDALKGDVEDVTLSDRLVESPACFVEKGEPISSQMRAFFKSMGQPVPEEKRVLELNPTHPLIKKIANEDVETKGTPADWATVLMALASLADGKSIENSKEFTDTLTKLLA